MTWMMLLLLGLLVGLDRRRWPLLAGLCSSTAVIAGCHGFAVLFAVMALDTMEIAALRRRNPLRHAKMLAANFRERPAIEPWCAVAEALRAHQARHGAKALPEGWTRCSGKIDQCHIKPRGMGGCNSDGATVYLCRTHHQEQEGRTAAFERRYGVDLRQAGERQHQGLGDLLL